MPPRSSACFWVRTTRFPLSFVSISAIAGLIFALILLFLGPLTRVRAATIMVINTNNSGAGSLRQALLDSNSSVGIVDTITFNISGSGVHIIQPLSALPPITDPINVDGTTQPGYAGTPLIVINGASAGSTVSGLTILAGNTTLKGLAINGFTQDGIDLAQHGSNTIIANYIGTEASGTMAVPNNRYGILVDGVGSNTIGSASMGNLISGNGSTGLMISNGASGNFVHGNLIGTDVTGTLALGNGNAAPASGITLSNSGGNYIGNAAAGSGNVISGNNGAGIYLLGTTTTETTIENNYIGIDRSGNAPLGNTNEGINLDAAYHNFIGGTSAGARNVISANGLNGLAFENNASSNLIQGNYIGTDAAGTAALGNGTSRNGNGILLLNAVNNVIGGTPTGEGNLISGNGTRKGGGCGISIVGSSTGNLVRGNHIGTDATGTGGLGNSNGVCISDTAMNNSVGGSATGAANVIASNSSGVLVIGKATSNPILTNSIFSNTAMGIDLGGDGVTPNDLGDADSGPNNLQNYPLMTSLVQASGNITIKGSLNSAASKAFRLEFFANTACDPSGYGEGQTYLGTTNVTTNASGDASFSIAFPLPVGRFISATATDPNNNTSEFSACKAITVPDTLGIYLNNEFYLTTDNQSVGQHFFFGPGGLWTPVTGDYDGNGVDTLGIVNNNELYLTNNNQTVAQHFYFGPGSQWKLVIGDWDGNGTYTVGITSNNEVYLSNDNSTVAQHFYFGPGGNWKLIFGDWDGNGTYTVGIVNNNEVYLTNDDATVAQHFWFGPGGSWKLIFGDWDGNGTYTVGIVNNNEVYLTNDNATVARHFWFGPGGNWQFIVGRWGTGGGNLPNIGSAPQPAPTFVPKR